jgi:hypothetical protein
MGDLIAAAIILIFVPAFIAINCAMPVCDQKMQEWIRKFYDRDQQ